MINSSFIKLNRVDDTLVMRLVKKKFRSSFWCVLLFYFLLLIIILTFITHLFINTKLTQINIADIIFKIVFLHFQAIKMNYRVCFQKFEYGSPPSHARKSCGRSVVYRIQTHESTNDGSFIRFKVFKCPFEDLSAKLIWVTIFW